MGFTGLAVTYTPTSKDAVTSARRCLTAEFGMGSGVSLALLPPNLQSPRPPCGGWTHETVFSRHLGFDFRFRDGPAVFRIG